RLGAASPGPARGGPGRAAPRLRAGEGRRDRLPRRHRALGAGPPRRGHGMVRTGPRHRSRQPRAAPGPGGDRRMTRMRILFALACAGVLAACATRPPAPATVPVLAPAAQAEAEALQAARAQALAAMPAWSLTG